MALTNKDVLNAKPKGDKKHCRLSDGHGLYLLVKAPPEGSSKKVGSKSWVLRVQLNGQRRDFGLGSFVAEPIPSGVPLVKRSSLTLSEAREKARIGREIAKAGGNPSIIWAQAEEVAETHTFEKAAREYYAHVAKGWRNGKHKAQWINTLELYAFPLIGSLSVDDVDASAIQRCLMPIWLTKGETARRVKQRIGVVLDYAKGKGWRKDEAPMRAVNQLMRGIRQAKSGNFAALPYDDLPALFSRLRSEEQSVGRLALQFLILTAARSGEVRKATWQEIDFDAAEWWVPDENAKLDRKHLVPLVPAALDILRKLEAMFGRKPTDFIFPGLKGIMSDGTLSKAFKGVGGAPHTVHGLRSTFRDWAAETGQPDAWAEAALSHKIPDKVEAAYRRTVYFNQRRDILMPAWAAFTLGPDNLVSLASRRA